MDDAIFLGQDRQLENTSWFLSAKEICVSLGVLCNQAPLQDSVFEARHKAQSRAHQFLNEQAVQRIGELYIFCFTRLVTGAW